MYSYILVCTCLLNLNGFYEPFVVDDGSFKCVWRRFVYFVSTDLLPLKNRMLVNFTRKFYSMLWRFCYYVYSPFSMLSW